MWKFIKNVAIPIISILTPIIIFPIQYWQYERISTIESEKNIPLIRVESSGVSFNTNSVDFNLILTNTGFVSVYDINYYLGDSFERYPKAYLTLREKKDIKIMTDILEPGDGYTFPLSFNTAVLNMHIEPKYITIYVNYKYSSDAMRCIANTFELSYVKKEMFLISKTECQKKDQEH